MKSTIDGAGRVVIPKAIRQRLGLEGGEALDIRERDGQHAAVPEEDLPPLTDQVVQETLERTRR